MFEDEGAGAEGPGPFPLLEPIGLLHGIDARAALQAGIALPLAGGPTTFTLIQIVSSLRGPPWGRGNPGPPASQSATRPPPQTAAINPSTLLPAPEAAHRWPAAIARLTTAPPAWASLPPGPKIMAILNATPDSFSDGGQHLDPAAARGAAERMLQDGADILDIGGESTRPGATPVPPEDEQARILPIIAALARQGATISVDTRNAVTMARALDAGARIVNDVTALAHDPAAAALVAARRCPVILMHMRGTPATMKSLAAYSDVAAEVAAELQASIARAEAAAIRPEQIAVDPGFGFAKTPAQSAELLTRLALLVALGRPIVAGLSRKAMIGMLTNEPDHTRRTPGSVAAALHALDRGATILRVHDVAATVQAVRLRQALAS